jgi:hypothetical protein
VKLDVRMGLQPAHHGRMRMGPVIVRDQMNSRRG